MENIPRYLKMTSEAIEKRINCELKFLNITAVQMRVIAELYNNPEKRILMKELEKTFNVTQATMQGIISRMKAKGYLSTECIENDKRAKCVVLTDDGILIAEKAMEKINKTQSIILSSLSENEAEAFIKSIKKIHSALK